MSIEITDEMVKAGAAAMKQAPSFFVRKNKLREDGHLFEVVRDTSEKMGEVSDGTLKVVSAYHREDLAQELANRLWWEARALAAITVAVSSTDRGGE